MEKLKPCPFCGGQARITRINGGYDSVKKEQYANYRVGCSKCNFDITGFLVSVIINDDGELSVKNNREQAIAAWNRRANDDVYVMQKDRNTFFCADGERRTE